MKGLELKINDQDAINLKLDGVVSIIVLYHEGITNITVSGLQNSEKGEKEMVTWLEQQLVEEDNVSINFNRSIISQTKPNSIKTVIEKEENEKKLLNYFALKKDLAENNLL